MYCAWVEEKCMKVLSENLKKDANWVDANRNIK
jgi:hypothetical protein